MFSAELLTISRFDFEEGSLWLQRLVNDIDDVDGINSSTQKKICIDSSCCSSELLNERWMLFARSYERIQKFLHASVREYTLAAMRFLWFHGLGGHRQSGSYRGGKPKRSRSGVS